MTSEGVRVGFDAGPWLDVRTGVGRYALELGEALTELGVQMVPYAVALRGRSHRDLRRWRLPARAVQIAWRRWGVPDITRLTGPIDVVHATNFVLPAIPTGVAGIVTVHDLSYLRDDSFPGADRLRDLVPWSLRRAACVLTPTQAIADEAIDTYALQVDSVRVTHEGVSPLFFSARPLGDEALARMGIRRPFVLAAGTIEPRKNLGRLLAAWAASRLVLEDWSLVIAGPHGWGPELPRTPGVVLPGWVGDETLPGLLAAADLFCYPSLYEGFGLPPLEAMATATPCLVGNYPAAREVLGDAAILVDPEDFGDIAMQLTRLATDEGLRTRLARAGRAQAARFSWTGTAGRTLDAYLSVL